MQTESEKQDLLFYDIEILKAIPIRTEERLDGIEYCDGWTDHAGMGISVIGMYFRGNYIASLAPFTEFKQALEQDPIVIGFNSWNFDDRVALANDIQVQSDYDLLAEVRKAAFGSPDWRKTPAGHSYSLGKLGEANGHKKTGQGSIAPIDWQKGKRQEVIAYCINDVKVTKAIYDLGVGGMLLDPNTGKKLKILSAYDKKSEFFF